jgi:hypothetical protein
VIRRKVPFCTFRLALDARTGLREVAQQAPDLVLLEDVVEVAGLLGGELPEAEIVHDRDVQGEPAAKLALEGVVGTRGVEGVEELGGLDVADGMPGAASGVAEGLREVALPHADWAGEDHVLLLGEPVEAEELADAGPIVADGGLPGDGLGRDLLLEAGDDEPLLEAAAVAAVDFVLEQELEKLQRTELDLAGMGRAVGPRGEQAAQAQALEATDQIRRDLHGSLLLSGRGG